LSFSVFAIGNYLRTTFNVHTLADNFKQRTANILDFGAKTLSFESSRLKGRIATLLMLLLPILITTISMALSLSHLLPSANPYVSIIFVIPSYASYILFLAAMNGLANYYSEPKIFKNSLYPFIISSSAGITSLILAYTFITPILDQFSACLNSPGNVPPTSIFLSLFQVVALIWLAVSVIGIFNGIFYRRAFYALAEKSGEQNFKQAGLFMFIGGIFMIIIVGGLIFFIGLIFAILGFYSIKPRASQNHSSSDTP
jgi:uncharacterized membrane protein